MSTNETQLFEKFGKIFNGDSVIFREGDFGDTMYIIQEGEVEIRKKAGNVFKVLTTLSSGDFFGEMALIDKSPRSASAVTTTKTKLLEVTHRSFEYMLEKNTDFCKKLVKELVEKIRNSNELIFELLTQNKKHRVANALVRFSRKNWNPSPEGNSIILSKFIEWSIDNIGIEKSQILEILNHFIKTQKVILKEQNNIKLLIIPNNNLNQQNV